MTENQSTGPRIYVADLAAYNAGILHGVWIDLDGKDEDEIQSEIDAMLRASPEPNTVRNCPRCDGYRQPSIWKAVREKRALTVDLCFVCGGKGVTPSAEEWAVHDYEGFEGLDPGEYPGLPTLVLWAKMLAQHGEAWSEYVDWQCDSATEEDFNERYQGEFDSPADFAQELFENLYNLDASMPHELRYHINWDSVARDMRYGGDFYFSDDYGPCHVFDAH